MEKICFMMIFTIEKLRYYLLYCTTYVVNPIDPLKYLITMQYLLGRFPKWLILLQEFDINVVKQKFVKG